MNFQSPQRLEDWPAHPNKKQSNLLKSNLALPCMWFTHTTTYRFTDCSGDLGNMNPVAITPKRDKRNVRKNLKSMTPLPLCYKKLILLWTTGRLVLRNWQWLVLRDLIFLSKWMRNSKILNKKGGVLCNYFQINILTWWLFLCTLNKFFHFLSIKKKKRKSDSLTILNV